MSDVYKNIASGRSGYIVAPAGCGKTEAIVKAVAEFSTGKQLILTHTHAGVGVLKKRFRKYNIPSEKFQIETISGWALNWVKKYPALSNYKGSLPLPESGQWNLIYSGAECLLKNNFVQWVIKNTYSGLIVDEYQDCTQPMHALILTFKTILPSRVLGDPLQGIFGFNEPLVSWENVETGFTENFGDLNTPYRWINAENSALGHWLIDVRGKFLNNGFPDFKNTPIAFETVDPAKKSFRVQELCRSLDGSLCVIGPKHGNFPPALTTALVNVGLRWVEPNDLPKVGECLDVVGNENDISKKADAAFKFIESTFAAFATKKDFIEKMLKGTIRRKPSGASKVALFLNHSGGYSHQLFLDIIDYLLIENIKCKKLESLKYLRKTLEEHIETGLPIKEIFSREISMRKFNGTHKPKRCLGTTLLLKGLEFDHAIILYNSSDKGWANSSDLYVAITRGSKSVHILA
ncbi:MAG: hypothetical protein ACXVLQ_12060 [Bacteriovorax sp.]